MPEIQRVISAVSDRMWVEVAKLKIARFRESVSHHCPNMTVWFLTQADKHTKSILPCAPDLLGLVPRAETNTISTQVC